MPITPSNSESKPLLNTNSKHQNSNTLNETNIQNGFTSTSITVEPQSSTTIINSETVPFLNINEQILLLPAKIKINGEEIGIRKITKENINIYQYFDAALNNQKQKKLIWLSEINTREVETEIVNRICRVSYVKNKTIKELSFEFDNITDMTNDKLDKRFKELLDKDLKKDLGLNEKVWRKFELPLKIIVKLLVASYINNLFQVYNTEESLIPKKENSTIFDDKTFTEEITEILVKSFDPKLIASQIVGVLWATKRVFFTCLAVEYCVNKPLEWLINKFWLYYKDNKNELQNHQVDENELKILKQYVIEKLANQTIDQITSESINLDTTEEIGKLVSSFNDKLLNVIDPYNKIKTGVIFSDDIVVRTNGGNTSIPEPIQQNNNNNRNWRNYHLLR